MLQYIIDQMPNRPKTPTTRSQPNPGSDVQSALIVGVWAKPFHPPKFSCRFPSFKKIVCSVILSCFVLLAESFLLIKIVDWFPDEWYD